MCVISDWRRGLRWQDIWCLILERKYLHPSIELIKRLAPHLLPPCAHTIYFVTLLLRSICGELIYNNSYILHTYYNSIMICTGLFTKHALNHLLSLKIAGVFRSWVSESLSISTDNLIFKYLGIHTIQETTIDYTIFHFLSHKLDDFFGNSYLYYIEYKFLNLMSCG